MSPKAGIAGPGELLARIETMIETFDRATRQLVQFPDQWSSDVALWASDLRSLLMLVRQQAEAIGIYQSHIGTLDRALARWGDDPAQWPPEFAVQEMPA